MALDSINWTTTSGTNFRLFTTNVAFEAAVGICEDHGMVLAKITEEPDFVDLQRIFDAETTLNADVYIGARTTRRPEQLGSVMTPSEFVFVDTVLDPTENDFIFGKERRQFPWGGSEPNSGLSSISGCVEMFRSNGYRLNDIGCGGTQPFLCSERTSLERTGEQIRLPGTDLFLVRQLTSFEDSKEACSGLDLTLAPIRTEDEYNKIKISLNTMAHSIGDGVDLGVWVGIAQGNEALSLAEPFVFEFVDSEVTETDFVFGKTNGEEPWAPTYPVNDPEKQCVSMREELNYGLTNDDCATENFFICSPLAKSRSTSVSQIDLRTLLELSGLFFIAFFVLSGWFYSLSKRQAKLKHALAIEILFNGGGGTTLA